MGDVHHLDRAIDPIRERVTTVCTCGRSLVAAPRADQEFQAREMGYASVWDLTAAHDPMHLTLATALDVGESPTLMRLVHDDPSFASDALVAYEEAAVLACQVYQQAVREGR